MFRRYELEKDFSNLYVSIFFFSTFEVMISSGHFFAQCLPVGKCNPMLFFSRVVPVKTVPTKEWPSP